ncbi:MAG TPA: peptidylprolyl isomerase [Vicinamibacterales bacterium]|jgi:parvulin-like peptidyl-prolyl isomerase|nr:peptidylprolyl isomerase [Vicinamibacterales bacterium]
MKRLLLSTLVVVSALAGVARAEILEQILVKVNGEILTKTDLEQRQTSVLRQRNPQALQDDEGLKRALQEITPQLLVDTVDEMLLVQRGRELGYKMTDEQFRGIIDNIKKENKLATDEQFNTALKQEGMTLEDLRRSIERRMLIDRVQQIEVMQKVGITEEEAKAYYTAHPDEFRTPATVTLREILVSIPAGDGKTINVAQEEEALAKAEAALGRITKGEDFGKVAAEVSDAASKANAGLIGPINKNELAPALTELLDGLKPGEVTKPLRSQRGYQIIKLESMSTSDVEAFEQVRDKIADRVYDEKRRGELVKYLVRLRAQAIIEWKNEELRKMYEQQVAAGAKTATQ